MPFSGWIAWPFAAGAACLIVSGRLRGIIAATTGVALTGLSTARDDVTGAALGAACLVVWLIIAWESREAWRHWLAKPLNLSALNVGSARTLRGRVRVLHLFLDTPKQSWRATTRASVLHMVDDACRWMCDAAQRYQTPLTFRHEVVNHTSVYHDGPIPTPHNDLDSDEKFRAFVLDVLDEMDHSHRRANRTPPNRSQAAENSCLLIHVAEDIGGVAYAVPAYLRQTCETPRVEYAVVGAWRNPSIYAHEILHLFGASDYRLSKFDDRDEVRRWDKLRESLLWRSIMFDGYHALSRLVVDEQTAQCVGWM
jgi:hypothetical protein